MIKVENVHVYNIGRAVYSARNPLNSWDKSDSDIERDIIGKNDMDLMQRLYKAGSEHRKYLRQIFVSMDVVAPLYWWKEMDQYRINVTTNSCSTMHKIHEKKFTLDDFSHEHLQHAEQRAMGTVIELLNCDRELYLETKNKDYWWQLIQMLPSSYNQKRTITMNYENVMNIINQRTGHKLDEWIVFVEALRTLPYIEEIRNESN